MSMMKAPARIEPMFAERVWGRRELAPWYELGPEAGVVGEAWLTGPECLVANGETAGRTLKQVYGEEFPLLVKMLFPAEKLSVQVHPDDAEAQALGLARGKTECWYVLEAEVGATVACGLKPGVSTADFAAAVRDGSAEAMLEMLPVTVGDMVFVDAGTVHAIGPGVTLLEVQQTCDVTYRLYDYGRPRELHLEAGLAVVKQRTGAGKVEPVKMDGFVRLIAARYFVVDRFTLAPGARLSVRTQGPGCVIGVAGQGTVDEVAFQAGEAVVLADGECTLQSEAGCVLVRCFAPAG